MRELAIGPGTKITLHFALQLDNGELVDTNFERDPATFTVGDGNLLPGFEKALFGMLEGEHKTVVIKPEDGFGQRNPNNIQEIARSQFSPDLELSEGLMLSFADAQKTELPGVVVRFDEDVVVVDFNHPLAGRDILFEVAILKIEPVQVH
ncbi:MULTISPECIES: peptidylprolyl isomerase [unclassified Cellvibrio]|jgi:FKBP-type peptidyl-prolyl cis-trans isomerase SlpA|uniref:FKBP-type peptidyl-prolyl cis-trans isomerase n=1 Tax=unclassified Cellvibrio TaxID=2624793 RepID=UPI0012490F9A|nr:MULTISPECIES: peptidylprolyl isomerase [unclassified Cellvibrio]QEY10992.1 peptidylprolyl isomerase [Cellvibrio sp. KY-YJ-3]UUA71041.1 peptidylprolyl isomerase [Cellvibrio sp. QJXJ]